MTVPLTKIETLIKNRQENYLEQLFVLLRQQSISAHHIGINECAELLQGMMQEIGITTKILETEGHPVVYGEMLQKKHNFTVLFYGHYDVQPPEPLEEWVSPPFEPTMRDGRIYARGAGDNKGQLMATLLGVKTYLDVFQDLPINLKFVFEGEEETGSPHLASFVEENKDLLQADLVITTDGSSH